MTRKAAPRGASSRAKVFLSYPSEHRPVADQVNLALLESGHDVFFDRTGLTEGDGFHDAIRSEIQTADLFVFLVSPESVERGSYCRTELKLARERWPHPRRRVLPVMIADTPFDSIPEYLASVNVLQPEGSVAAEVSAAVEAMRRDAPDSGGGAQLGLLDRLRGGLRASAEVLVAATAITLGVAAAFQRDARLGPMEMTTVFLISLALAIPVRAGVVWMIRRLRRSR